MADGYLELNKIHYRLSKKSSLSHIEDEFFFVDCRLEFGPLSLTCENIYR